MTDSTAMSRRNFLETAGAGLAAGALAQTGVVAAGAAEDEKRMLIIDCHAHIYGEDEKKYPTIAKPYRPPAGKGTIAHLKGEMKANGVKYVTAIQTSTFYRWDNRFTTDSSRDHADFMVGVCTLDPDDPASPALLEEYVKHKNVRGMRSIPGKSGKLDDRGVDKLWETAERLGIVINALVGRDKRGEIERLVRRHPKLNVIIDHCLNLKAGPTLKPTLKDMLQLSELPTVHAKLTFIPTGSAEDYPCRDMYPACHDVINAFTPERCVWGSDFPCELWLRWKSHEKPVRATYGQHLRIFTHELGLDEKSKRAILGQTAHKLWFRPHKES